MSKKHFFLGVKGVISTKNGVILLKRQVKPGIFVWEAPGGRVEDGEDYKTTLARELSEELPGTARFTIEESLGGEIIAREPEPGVGLVLMYFKVTTSSTDFSHSDEHLAMKHVSSVDDIPENTDPGLKQVLSQLL